MMWQLYLSIQFNSTNYRIGTEFESESEMDLFPTKMYFYVVKIALLVLNFLSDFGH